MNFEEFLVPRGTAKDSAIQQEEEQLETDEAVVEENVEATDLDVQKAVVESLAADKAEQDEIIEKINKEKEQIKQELSNLKERFEEISRRANDLLNELAKKNSEIQILEDKLNEQNATLAKVGDILTKNAETEGSSKISLLDRNVDIEDRFEGETRDHVLEILKEAKAKAEQEGRIRRAQVLEAVLMANEATGNLSKKREALNKIFADNQNIINGVVIKELNKIGLSHKNGDQFLMTSEIMKRNY